jgi:hypothetical protein
MTANSSANPPENKAETSIASKTSGLAKLSLALAGLTGVLFLNFCGFLAEAWHGVHERGESPANAWNGLFGGSVGHAAGWLTVAAGGTVLCSILALSKLPTSGGGLRGKGLAVAAIVVSLLLVFCMFWSRGDLAPGPVGAGTVARYRKDAEQNDAVAQYNLGLCYAKGIGVTKNDEEAATWFRQAAEQNHVWAQCNLGHCYSEGRGVAKDVQEAVKWYRRAAEQNDAIAQYDLGMAYKNGRGTAQNNVEAYKWMSLAAEQGLNDAKTAMTAMEAMLSAEELAKAKELVGEFRERPGRQR